MSEWVNNKTWDPTLLTDSRKQPASKAVEAETIPDEEVAHATRVSTVYEPDIHDNYYEWLYQDIGGQG